MKAKLIAFASVLMLSACMATTPPPPSPPPPAPPPPPPPPPGYALSDQIVVTGSQITRSRFVASSPVATVDAEAVAFGQVIASGSLDLEPVDRDRFEDVDPNPVIAVADEPVSTFSIDVDTASYSVVRRRLEDGQLPPSDAVRVEEMVNYFDYEYALPQGPDEPFATHVEVMPSPWNADTQLLHIGIQGYEVVPEERPRANLVFLIDVSGSMNSPDKLPLAVDAMHMLVDELDPDDTVSIVVYAGAAGAVLEPTEARHARRIHTALDRLSAGGSTAGGAGLALAYDLAERNFDPEAVNRVMLLTDGDFNVGQTRDESLEDFITRKRESGIYLSIMGFGRGNYNDQLMQTLAQAGNGTAGYIDSRREARRMLVEESASSLFPIAEDVKIQIEFNPARVSEYRLIGYETRMLENADFNNDRVDAGEIGSGHSVTAIYEIAAPGSDGLLLEPSRYQPQPDLPAELSNEFAHLRLRYKRPGEDESRLIERPVTTADAVETFEEAGDEARFSVHVAGFAQLLRDDPYLRDAAYDWSAIREGASGLVGEDELGFREEFLGLVDRARYLDESAGQKTP